VTSAWAGCELDITYKSAFPISNCQFVLPGFIGPLRVFEGVKSEKYKFIGDYKKGICAIRLKSARKENSGVAYVEVMNNNGFETAVRNVNVKYLQLTSTSAFNFHQFKEHQQMDFNCTAHGVNPQKILEILHGTNLMKSQ
jgi:hypothetical protein